MASMQDRRVWLGGGAVAAVLIAAASWFMLIHPELSSADDLHGQAADQRARNDQTAHTVSELKSKSEHLQTYTRALAEALEALPVDSGLPAFTTQTGALAADDHVTVTSISVGALRAIGSSTATAPATTPDSNDNASAASEDTSTTSTSTTPTSAAGSVFAIPVTLVSSGSLAHQSAFLEDLRSAGPRYGLVTNVQLAPGANASEASLDGPNTMTTQVTIFCQPQTPEQISQLRKLLRGDIGS